MIRTPLPDALRPVISAVEARVRERGRAVLVMDGMSAAGKTTAGEVLSALWSAPVVHMDDFFLPRSLRTPERLAEPGGNVHYERFREEVLPGLRAGKAFSYRAFCCASMDYAGRIAVPAAAVTLVEGAYAMHPLFGDYGDVTVFFSIDPGEQERRIRRRNGGARWPDFRDRWIPMENHYHAAFRTRDRADFIV